MKILRLIYPLLFLCRVLGVSRSGYYGWLNRKPSKHAQEEERLEVEIKTAHKRNRETSGPETLQKDLKEHGIKDFDTDKYLVIVPVRDKALKFKYTDKRYYVNYYIDI